MQTISVTQTIGLEVISCCVCAVRFAVPESIMEERRRNAGSIWCPNGHYIGWQQSEADKVRKELEEARRQLSGAKCDTMREREAREVAEKELARHKKRTKNGVCPCCQRSFTNLQRHIQTKHPDFAKA